MAAYMKHRQTLRLGRVLLSLAVIALLAGCAVHPQQAADRGASGAAAATNGEPVFTSTAYGFRLPYPAELALRRQPDPGYLLSDQWKLYADSDAMPGQAALALRLPASNEVTTAALRIGASRNPASLRSCRDTPAATVPDSIGSTRIDGVMFTTFAARDAGMSHYMTVHGYRAVHAGTCYALDVVVYGTNPKVYDPPRTPPFTRQQAFARLTPVVAGLTFITPTAGAQ